MANSSWRASVAVIALVLAGCGEDAATPVETTEATPAAVEETQADPSQEFLDMAARHAAMLLTSSPELATELNIGPEVAGELYQYTLGSYGFQAHQNARAMNEQFIQELRSHDRDALTGVAATTYDILETAYRTAARRNQFEFGGATQIGAGQPNSGSSWAVSPYFLTQLTGVHIYLPSMLQTQHRLAGPADVDAYLARMEDFGRAFDETIETLGNDAAIGVSPPKFVAEGVLRSIEGLTAPAPASHPIVVHLLAYLSKSEDFDDAQKSEIRAKAVASVENTIYPAYGRLKAQVEALRDQAGAGDGVWRLGEQGEAFYQMALAAYGGQGKSADEIHEIGLAEVARISAEMDGLLQSIGLVEGTVGERIQQLSARPDNTFANTDEGREELLSYLRVAVDDIMAVAPDWFSTIPSQPVEVRRIPVYEQDSSPGGYYTAASLDGERPGIYWINLKDTADNPKHGLKTLTYHEAVPGHHFQISFSRAIEGMPILRKILSYSEFEEGWALYTEALAKEMGMYEGDPEGDLGRLQAELFRAARLVVDTGLHQKRWTRQEAIDYMVAATGESRASVSREVERYAAIPGQACSYKLGMLAIQDMRAKAEAELGDSFDLKGFHQEILSTGSAPIGIVSARIDAWIARNKG